MQVGFNISPVLWRKLPGARSAGRVQSVALRLLSDREAEVEAFKACTVAKDLLAQNMSTAAAAFYLSV